MTTPATRLGAIRALKFVFAGFGLLVAVPATTAHPVRADATLVVDARIGPAFLTKSRSHAIGHLFKPALRLGVRVPRGERLELGGTAVGLVTTSEHYRVLGALAQARYALWLRSTFSLGASAALGMGYDADILHSDLHAKHTVAPYGFLAVDGRWTILNRGFGGVEAAWENLAAFHLGLLIGWRM